MSRADLEALLDVQVHDTALDRLRRRRDTLESRTAHEAALVTVADLETRQRAVGERRDEIAALVGRLDDEAASVKEHATKVEATLYSGEVASPRELQALQADLAQLQRQQRGIEDRELEAMEVRETVDTELASIDQQLAEARGEADRLGAVLAAEEADIDAEASTETAARDELVGGVADSLVRLYERCRDRAHGIGIARLEGNTCQGCRLAVPATDAVEIRKADPDTVSHCENCGAILVA